MSINNDGFTNNPQPLAKRKFVLPKISNTAKTARICDKNIKVLSFIDGEEWSVMKVLSYVLRLGERQTQKTLSGMCKSKLLKHENLDKSTRLYGNTAAGRAYLNNGSINKTHQLGKTVRGTVDHHVLCQMCRVELTRNGARDWVPGKVLFKNKFFNKIYDGLFSYGAQNRTGGLELERTPKSSQRAIEVFKNHVADLGGTDECEELLHVIIYFTPYPQAIQDFINKYVPSHLRGRFLVLYMDDNLENIKPYKPNELYFDNVEITKFLDRNS
jgi:hypothetical protein